jgi:hypothetical protein
MRDYTVPVPVPPEEVRGQLIYRRCVCRKSDEEMA